MKKLSPTKDPTDWVCETSLKPGQKGTLKEYRRYGDDLLAVRYRNNGQGLRIKTVEIVVSISKVDILTRKEGV